MAGRKPTCLCGECSKCRNREAKRKNRVRVSRNQEVFPKAITIWECSDGSSHNDETAATWHELELFRTGRK